MDHSLIITNGGSAAQALWAAGITAPVLTWDDVLHDGPVPGGLTEAELRRVRGRFLSDGGSADAPARLEERDRRLDEAVGQGMPLVLWFEHDLYDQLQLVQVLDRLGSYEPVFLVPEHTFIALRGLETLPGQLAAALKVSSQEREAGRMAWRAFTAPTPETVDALVHGAGQTGPLPHLTAALQRWMEMFPDAAGISRTERSVLELVSVGPRSGKELFLETQKQEEAEFRGDWSFAMLLRDMQGLVESSEAIGEWAASSWRMTPLGEAVLRGTDDRIHALGLDTWRGGTHLRRDHCWRLLEGRLRLKN